MNLLYLCTDWILVKTYMLATTCVLEDEQWSFDWIHRLERKFSSIFFMYIMLAAFNIGKNQNESMRYPVSNPYNLVYNMRDNSECLRVFPALWDFLFYSSCYQVQWSVILSSLRFRVEWNCEIHVMRFSHFLLPFPSQSFFTTITALNLRYPRLFLMAQLCPVCVYMYVSTSSPRA